MYNVLIVGSGFSGSVLARELAETYDRKVLILEKRKHIAGNMYEKNDVNDVRVHLYGPHIFHTNNEKVLTYLKRFSDFYPYEHTVVGRIDEKLVPIPFNFQSIDELFPEKVAKTLKDKLVSSYPDQIKISILDLLDNKDEEIRIFGEFVYEKVFVNYTAKQWNQPIEEVDTSVINRVPVILGYDNRYFQDEYQYMPENGFTALFENMLNHSNIDIELNCDATERLKLDLETKKIYFDGEEWNGTLIYTGPLDELFNYEYGPLPYRSLNLVFEQYPVTAYQPAAVVNYPNEEDFTRITEFKYLTKQILDGSTTILKEYPMNYDPKADKGNIPYYPITNTQNKELYESYRIKAAEFKHLYVCGRLAEYKYYNMDAAVNRALELSEEIGANE